MLATWQIVAGTVGFAVCLMALGAWLFCAAASRLDLEDDSDAASDPASPVRLAWSAPLDARRADDRRGRDREAVALSQLRADMAQRLVDIKRRRESEAKVYRICRSVRDGGKYPAA